MDRRDFMAGAAGLGASQATSQGPAGAAGRSQYIELRYYRIHQGGQGARLNNWVSKTLLPLMKKHGFGAAGFFNVSIGPTPTMVGMTAYPSMAAWESSWTRLGRDPDFGKSLAELESDVEPAFDRAEAVLLRAADYSMEPKVSTEKPKTPRVFEL